MPDQRALMTPRLVQQVGKTPPTHGNQRRNRARIRQLFVISSEQPSAKSQQCRAAIGDALRLHLLLEQGRPAILKGGDLPAAHAARKEMLGDCTQPRLGRDNAMIELLETLSPPGEFDCPQRWLRRAGNHIAHRRIDLEKRLERGPQVRSEQPQHLRTIAADGGG
jgi:hypothetical protein